MIWPGVFRIYLPCHTDPIYASHDRQPAFPETLTRGNENVLTALPPSLASRLCGEIITLQDLFETIVDLDLELFLLGTSETGVRLESCESGV